MLCSVSASLSSASQNPQQGALHHQRTPFKARRYRCNNLRRFRTRSLSSVQVFKAQTLAQPQSPIGLSSDKSSLGTLVLCFLHSSSILYQRLPVTSAIGSPPNANSLGIRNPASMFTSSTWCRQFGERSSLGKNYHPIPIRGSSRVCGQTTSVLVSPTTSSRAKNSHFKRSGRGLRSSPASAFQQASSMPTSYEALHA